MTHTLIDQAFILAAGRGERMRPLTDTCPKPLIQIWGKPIIGYALDMLARHGSIKTCVINTHYLADQLHAYVKTRDLPFTVHISHEDQLLETGGGLLQGCRFLDVSKPVCVLSGDSMLVDPVGGRSLQQLQDAWRDQDMDLLLSLQPLSTMALTKGAGDYDMEEGAGPKRSLTKSGKYVWNSARILHPRLLNQARIGPYSFLEDMDRAEKSGRLSGVVHGGLWHHFTTPADVAAVNQAL
jgi:N-acetyl-alpha-D-muramate 1-phosphate uridylyltransferase